MDLCQQVRGDERTLLQIATLLTAMLNVDVVIWPDARAGWKGARPLWCTHQLTEYALDQQRGMRPAVKDHDGCPAAWAGGPSPHGTLNKRP